MPLQRNSFNVLGAAGICAALALLGWEINTREHGDTRFLSITVPEEHDTDSDDDMAPSPDDNHHHDGLDNHNWYPNGRDAPDDGDDYYDGSAKHTDPDAPTPI